MYLKAGLVLFFCLVTGYIWTGLTCGAQCMHILEFLDLLKGTVNAISSGSPLWHDRFTIALFKAGLIKNELDIHVFVLEKIIIFI